MIECINVPDSRLESEYKKFLNSGSHFDLIRIIKTAYLRNKRRVDQKKKVGEKDLNYMQKAEKSLYGEFSAVLGISYDETKLYVERAVYNLVEKKKI